MISGIQLLKMNTKPSCSLETNDLNFRIFIFKFKLNALDYKINIKYINYIAEWDLILELSSDIHYNFDMFKTLLLYILIFSLFALFFAAHPPSSTQHLPPPQSGAQQFFITHSQPYHFIIEPQAQMFLKLQGTQKNLHLYIRAQMALKICGTQKTGSPGETICEVIEKTLVLGKENIALKSGESANFEISNDHQQKVQFMIYFSSDDCSLISMGETFIKQFGKQTESNKRFCLLSYIDRIASLEINVKLGQGKTLSKGQVSLHIRNQTIDMLQQIYQIPSQQMAILCGENLNSTGTGSCFIEIGMKNLSGVEAEVMVQHTDNIIKLMDGFGHTVQSKMRINQPHTFYYNLLKRKNTTIFLENVNGAYRIWTKMISGQQFESAIEEKKVDLFPKSSNSQVSSSNPYYLVEQTIIISEQDIAKYCPSPQNLCVIMISVTLTGHRQVQNKGKFVIECTQQNRIINRMQLLQGYLPKYSVAYYTYLNDQKNGSLIIKVNNHNMKCLNIYINQGTEKPTRSKNTKGIAGSNGLIIENADRDIYSIAVQANENCPYTIQVIPFNNHISVLKKGSFIDFHMQKKQVRYLTLKNDVNEKFKILSMHKMGQIIISVKPMDNPAEIGTIRSLNEIQDYVWVNQDYVRIDNTTSNGQLHQKYCYSCTYLIKVEALRETVTTLSVSAPDSSALIRSNSIIKDSLMQNQSTDYHFFTSSSPEFEINVMYGEIKIEGISEDEGKKIVEDTYEVNQKPIRKTFRVFEGVEKWMRYGNLRVSAFKQSYYTFKLIREKTPDEKLTLKYGIPEIISIEDSKEYCLMANINRFNDTFYLSFEGLDPQEIDSVSVIIRKNSPLNAQQQFRKNLMVLSFPIQSPMPGQCQLCISGTDVNFRAIVVQSSPIIYYPANKPIAIKNELNLTFLSFGKSIIEVNSCQGDMKIAIFQEFRDLGYEQRQIQYTKLKNDIIECHYDGSIFVNFKVSSGSVRWFVSDQNREIGLGYQIYETGTFDIKNQGQNITIIAEPLKAIKTTQNRILSIKYYGYAAKEKAQLVNSINCGNGQQTQPFTSNQLRNQMVLLHIPTSSLKLQETDSLFVSMKTDLQVINKEGNIESYRFLYPFIEVTPEIFVNPPLQNNTEIKKTEAIKSVIAAMSVMVVMILISVVGLCLYKRCIIKSEKTIQIDRSQTQYSLE